MQNARHIGNVSELLDMNQLRVEVAELLLRFDRLTAERQYLLDMVELLRLLLAVPSEQTRLAQRLSLASSQGDLRQLTTRVAVMRRDLSDEDLPPVLAQVRGICRQALDDADLTHLYTERIC